MKNLFTILLSCLMISLFLSCSMEPEQDFVENEKETFESLKMKVEAMAQEYGVGVSINERVWRKRLPSIDDIEKDFIRIKELSAATRSNMDSTSVNQSYTSVFSNANTNISALENKPRVLKTSTERLPDRGSFLHTLYVHDASKQVTYEIEIDVDWQFGGALYYSSVEFDAKVKEYVEDFYHPYYGDYVPNTTTRILSSSYNFYGSRIIGKGKSFSGSSVVEHYYYNDQISPEEKFTISTTYNNSTGIGMSSVL
ncbi:MAG: hypothetical protein J6R12_00905 [Bacteroidales bacterium]|nr:hypothetical protein [Bacteroidales bacterium]